MAAPPISSATVARASPRAATAKFASDPKSACPTSASTASVAMLRAPVLAALATLPVPWVSAVTAMREAMSRMGAGNSRAVQPANATRRVRAMWLRRCVTRARRIASARQFPA